MEEAEEKSYKRSLWGPRPPLNDGSIGLTKHSHTVTKHFLVNQIHSFDTAPHISIQLQFNMIRSGKEHKTILGNSSFSSQAVLRAPVSENEHKRYLSSEGVIEDISVPASSNEFSSRGKVFLSIWSP